MSLTLLEAQDGWVQTDFVYIPKVEDDEDGVIIGHDVVGDTLGGMSRASPGHLS